jgi:hypothetical protein
MKNTQLKMIKDQLLLTGEVSRNWCLQRYCSRLGARIMDLKKEGWVFTTEKRNGDYVYKLEAYPGVLTDENYVEVINNLLEKTREVGQLSLI